MKRLRFLAAAAAAAALVNTALAADWEECSGQSCVPTALPLTCEVEQQWEQDKNGRMHLVWVCTDGPMS